MIESLRARITITVVTLVVACIWLVPNFKNVKDSWWFSQSKIVLGLDIQGGLHLVLRVDVDGVLKEKALRQGNSLVDSLKSEGVTVGKVALVEDQVSQITLEVSSTEVANKVESYIDDNLGAEMQVLEKASDKVVVRFLDSAVSNYRKQIVDQSIEVIRNRIDEMGTLEPNISAQGEDRIIVQIPGIEDSAKAKQLINKTARLEFRIVNTEFSEAKLIEIIEKAEEKGGYALGKDELVYSKYIERLNDDIKAELPEGYRLVFEKDRNAKALEVGKQPVLIMTSEALTGDMLSDAFVGRGEYNEPVVSFRMNVKGRVAFKEFTTKHKGKPMAIILDDVVKSVATIQGVIEHSGQITLGRSSYNETYEEASFIATTLRVGALPAKLEQLEERTVGPTLGADSISRGAQAGLVGLVLVLLFMFGYYRTMGLIANIALLMNVIMILAILSTLGATLTLPGVAGLVLTIGMAVDANVIIFERIKEEVAKGAGIKAAVKDGFGQAFSAIFDANITTAAVCIVLMYFGTGPVRGFAVTLICGIVTSMFTAIFVSRTLMDVLIHKFNAQIIGKKG